MSSLWDVDHSEARERISARRKRIAKRLEMSAKLSAGLDQLLQADREREEAASRASPTTPTTATSDAVGGKDIDGVADGQYVKVGSKTFQDA